METIDDVLDLIGLPEEEDDDDMCTYFSGDASLEGILDFNIQVTDLCSEVEYDADHEDLSNVDWDKVDWEHVAANWQPDELEPLSANQSAHNDEHAHKNKRRRLSEVERLEKYSWQRLPLREAGKRLKYKRVDGHM